jgi:undecaprenyl diphosphate synthase
LSDITPEGLARIAPLGLKPEQMPRHVAIIMDGNGRWAQSRGYPRVIGHREGIKSVRSIVEEGCRLGLEQITLYCLSVENWKRPARELNFLFRLLRRFLVHERDLLMEQKVRLTMIGRREGLPSEVLSELDQTVSITSENQGMNLCLAINYGGRTEIADAVKLIGREIKAGRLDPEQINESTIEQYLYTAGMSDPDLLIRTSGEMRVSNYLLWQISYSEIWVTNVLWPDFRGDDLLAGCQAYAGRERKFGGLPEATTATLGGRV